MPDIAQARAEKAYPIDGNRVYTGENLVNIAKSREDYKRGWTESQREPISDAEVEAALKGYREAQSPDTYSHYVGIRGALTAAAQARVSAESEKP